MSKDPPTFRVFYSWQSDLPNVTNRGFIEECLENVKKTSSSKWLSGTTLVIDSATRDESGSPHIPDTILKKVLKCDVLVADLSTITPSDSKGRRTPNPNVLIELGFGVGVLGWNRIISVVNKAFGRFPDDLPFDIDRRRTESYERPEHADATALITIKAKLTSVLSQRLKGVFEVNPPRPTLHHSDDIRRARDVAKLIQLCSTFSIAKLESHFADATMASVSDETLFYFECFDGLMSSIDFHLYDAKVRGLAETLRETWHGSLPPPDLTELQGSRYRIVTNKGPVSERVREAIRSVRAHAAALDRALRDFVAYCREHYIEIDFDETSSRALMNWTK